MGPTISDRTNAAAASSSGLGSSRRPVPVEDQRKADLIHRVKYNNALPDIPFDLKFLSYPFDTSRFDMSLVKLFAFSISISPVWIISE